MRPRPSRVRATALPAVTDIEEAATDATLIHEDLGTNVTVHWVHGGAGDQGVFETAPVIVTERYVQPRLIPNAIEPRGCLAYGVQSMGEYTLVSSTQIPHIVKVTLSGVTGIAEQKPPRDRAGRRRRVRLEAERLRRGGAGARPGEEAGRAGEVDRGARRRTTSPRSTAAASCTT